jgi:hypothetical protein
MVAAGDLLRIALSNTSQVRETTAAVRSMLGTGNDGMGLTEKISLSPSWDVCKLG